MSESPVAQVDHQHDAEYGDFMARMNARFVANIGSGSIPLFVTNAEGLWETYLNSFIDHAERQYHTCHCCRNFVQRFGGLVTIDETGIASPAIWNEDDAPEHYKPAVAALARAVRRAKVAGVFLSSDKVYGTPETGAWRHLSVTPPASIVFKRATQTAFQASAEKSEDFKTVMHALNEFTQPMLEQALTLLRTDSLYRSEKVLGQAEWLYGLHVARAAAKGGANVVWRAIATAPAGFCHPRSSMIGTLLEDIAAGMEFSEVSRRFKAKMHPLQYQRPQAAPTAGAIAQAEKLMEQLGATGSLARRFAKVEEIEALWRPAAQKEEAETVGVFGHLKAKGAGTVSEMRTPPVTITWDKFARTVLPDAAAISLMAPSAGAFVGMVTATNADAPPIIQWDREECRNPFSWYLYAGMNNASNWSLQAGTWAKVTAAALFPPMWHGGGFDHQGKRALFVIEGQRDKRDPSLCLFPEILKSEFHGVRSVIEAYSHSKKLDGADEASANGIEVIGAHVRVKLANGPEVEYKIDRWD